MRRLRDSSARRKAREVGQAMCLALCCAASTPAFAATQHDAETVELEDLRGLPRLGAELDLLERHGELARLTAPALDDLLERSGRGTLDQLFAALSDGLESEAPELSDARVRLLEEALDVYPAWVITEQRGEPGVFTRRTDDALRVLRERGGAEDLALTRELVDPRDPDERPDRRSLRSYEAALTAILNRDGQALSELEADWDDWPENLWTSTVKAVGGCASSESLDLLTWLLRRAEGTQVFLVQQVGRVAETSRLPGDFALHGTLISFAGAQDHALRREACMALGKLQCSEAIDVLILCLDDPNSGVRAAAYWGLQQITGKQLKAEPARWQAWYAGESRWWRDEFPAFREKLRSDDVAEIGVAIREVGRRKLRRHELAAELLPLLEDEREAVVCMSIAGLGALGSALAVEPLAQLLTSDSENVRQLALKALRSITGRDDLPAEAEAWVSPWHRS